MSNFRIKALVLGMVQTNCYIVSNEATGEAIVFDPADNALRIEEFLLTNHLICKGILLTHGHFDHILAAKELSGVTKAPIYAGKEEARLLNDAGLNISAQVGRECTLVPDILLQDKETLSLAGFPVQVIHTPGHTSGGVCYFFTEEQVLISGDTLFHESIGRTDLPTGNTGLLVESIRSKLLILEDQLMVYPGHGGPTTIGYEKAHNYYISDVMQ